MALEFKLPDIGEGVVEGEIVRWMIHEGEVVCEDQPMVEVMTDKATVEIPSPRAGVVKRILVPAGKLCAVGQVMLVIDTEGQAAGAGDVAAARPGEPPHHHPGPAHAPQPHPGPQQDPQHAPEPHPHPTPGPPPHHPGPARPPEPHRGPAHAPDRAPPHTPPPEPPPLHVPGPGRKVLATPATRQLARSLSVDISRLAGSGPNGRVTKDDVRGAAPRPAVAPTAAPAPLAATAAAPASAPPAAVAAVAQAGDERLPFRGVRRKIADNMLRAKHSAAHFTYVEECDATELVALRERARRRAAEHDVKLSFLPFFIKAVVSGLKKYPILNATLDAAREEIVLRKSYHIGVATATEAGLLVPVLRDADKLSLLQIAAALEPLAERARTGKAHREELVGSTFTITSLGTLGGVLATPIINFPEVAVLGVHKMRDTPVVRDGQIVIRAMMNLSLSLDHRIVDGYEGAQFLAHVIGLLQDPTLMFMELV